MINNDCKPTHIAYADESSYNIGRYRSVAVVTLKVSDVKKLDINISTVINKFNSDEFKWNKLKSAQNKFFALEIIDKTINFILEGKLRIDVITWDIEDTRHKIRRRSDIRNLRRMYYFLFRNTLSRRWPETSRWELRPDKTSFGTALHLSYLGNPDEINEDARKIRICQIVENDSKKEPILQIADLFAGIGSYSRNSFSVYKQWKQSSLNSQVNLNKKLSNSDKERCQVIEHISQQCKRNKLGVSLDSVEGLKSRNPKYPLNFWWYESQGEYDKAPIWH